MGEGRGLGIQVARFEKFGGEGEWAFGCGGLKCVLEGPTGAQSCAAEG